MVILTIRLSENRINISFSVYTIMDWLGKLNIIGINAEVKEN